jgi:16S rRNA G966 N2-methylase RsmD
MFVTTVPNPAPALIERATRIANTINWPYVERGRETLSGISKRLSAHQSITIHTQGAKFEQPSHSPLFFHPSMGHVRMKRLLKGETDRMLQIAHVEPGDRVLDCTAGLCSDALVFAHALGDAGEVVALESNPILAAVIADGLQHYASELHEVNDALRRIRYLNIDHYAYLTACPADAFDIVYFDPMFDDPQRDSQSMEPLRHVANEQPLTKSTITEAIRVARKAVVMKNSRGSAAFAKFGFTQVELGGTNIAFGVIHV